MISYLNLLQLILCAVFQLNITPSYKVLHESGPDHDKQFTIGIFFGSDFIAEGKGKSKQEAEQQAAHEALEIKEWLD